MAVTLGAGALIAAERGDRRVHVVVEDATRCRTEPTTDEMARAAGVLLGQARQANIVDALVVLGAARRGDEILTSDPDDLAALAAVAPTPVRITVI